MISRLRLRLRGTGPDGRGGRLLPRGAALGLHPVRAQRRVARAGADAGRRPARDRRSRDAPVLIDQEGGRVQRLGPPHWRRYPPGRAFGDCRHDPPTRAPGSAARLIAHDLAALGINVDCAPVLDVPDAGRPRHHRRPRLSPRRRPRWPCSAARAGRGPARRRRAAGRSSTFPATAARRPTATWSCRVVDASRAELEAWDFAPFRSARRPADGDDRARGLLGDRSGAPGHHFASVIDEVIRGCDRLRRPADQRRPGDEGAVAATTPSAPARRSRRRLRPRARLPRRPGPR